jgi:hypothetical protein
MVHLLLPCLVAFIIVKVEASDAVIVRVYRDTMTDDYSPRLFHLIMAFSFSIS